MKFIIDENLPQRLGPWLSQRGHDAVHVRDEPDLQSDRAIAEKAVREARVILTKDNDFDPPRYGERVLHLRVGNCNNSALFAWLEARLDNALERFARGEAYVDVD
jgi:predicted nuclease of predicted toxin-antitoxin system